MRCAIYSFFFVAGILGGGCAWAIQDRADMDPNDPVKSGQSVAWKATFASYKDTENGYANDVNVRGNTIDNTFWLGSYRDASGFSQFRAGAEHASPVSFGRIITSMQLASGGFAGVSVTWDGKRDNVDGFSPLLGWGRTNAKTYYNLNFDPNDSVLWGGTYTAPQVGQFSIFQIYDDRLGTGQRVTHWVWRGALPNAWRLTADLFARQGRSDVGQPWVKGHGAALTVDFRDFFARIAKDQKANFSEGDTTRLAFGFRF